MGLMASFERGMERFLVPVAIKGDAANLLI